MNVEDIELGKLYLITGNHLRYGDNSFVNNFVRVRAIDKGKAVYDFSSRLNGVLASKVAYINDADIFDLVEPSEEFVKAVAKANNVPLHEVDIEEDEFVEVWVVGTL